jgi:RNA polymerase sigma-70 factor (ECF subfamily)
MSTPGHHLDRMHLAIAQAPARATTLDFAEVYEAHLAFVWRNLRRLGLRDAAIDDAVQEVFIVVHRRLAELATVESLSGWLYGVLRRVAATHRRSVRRRGTDALPETLAGGLGPAPDEAAARAQASRWLAGFLDELPEDQRHVFVLIELEQLPAGEVAASLGLSINTIYSRLRLARSRFERAVAGGGR